VESYPRKMLGEIVQAQMRAWDAPSQVVAAPAPAAAPAEEKKAP